MHKTFFFSILSCNPPFVCWFYCICQLLSIHPNQIAPQHSLLFPFSITHINNSVSVLVPLCFTMNNMNYMQMFVWLVCQNPVTFIKLESYNCRKCIKCFSNTCKAAVNCCDFSVEKSVWDVTADLTAKMWMADPTQTRPVHLHAKLWVHKAGDVMRPPLGMPSAKWSHVLLMELFLQPVCHAPN